MRLNIYEATQRDEQIEQIEIEVLVCEEGGQCVR